MNRVLDRLMCLSNCVLNGTNPALIKCLDLVGWSIGCHGDRLLFWLAHDVINSHLQFFAFPLDDSILWFVFVHQPNVRCEFHCVLRSFDGSRFVSFLHQFVVGFTQLPSLNCRIKKKLFISFYFIFLLNFPLIYWWLSFDFRVGFLSFLFSWFLLGFTWNFLSVFVVDFSRLTGRFWTEFQVNLWCFWLKLVQFLTEFKRQFFLYILIDFFVFSRFWFSFGLILGCLFSIVLV